MYSQETCDWISCHFTDCKRTLYLFACRTTFILAPQSVTPTLKTAMSGVVTTGKHSGWSLIMRLLGSISTSVSVVLTEKTKCPSREQSGESVKRQKMYGVTFKTKQVPLQWKALRLFKCRSPACRYEKCHSYHWVCSNRLNHEYHSSILVCSRSQQKCSVCRNPLAELFLCHSFQEMLQNSHVFSVWT